MKRGPGRLYLRNTHHAERAVSVDDTPGLRLLLGVRQNALTSPSHPRKPSNLTNYIFRLDVMRARVDNGGGHLGTDDDTPSHRQHLGGARR